MDGAYKAIAIMSKSIRSNMESISESDSELSDSWNIVQKDNFLEDSNLLQSETSLEDYNSKNVLNDNQYGVNQESSDEDSVEVIDYDDLENSLISYAVIEENNRGCPEKTQETIKSKNDNHRIDNIEMRNYFLEKIKECVFSRYFSCVMILLFAIIFRLLLNGDSKNQLNSEELQIISGLSNDILSKENEVESYKNTKSYTNSKYKTNIKENNVMKIEDISNLKNNEDKIYSLTQTVNSNNLSFKNLIQCKDGDSIYVSNQEHSHEFFSLNIKKMFKVICDLNLSRHSKDKLQVSIILFDSLLEVLNKIESENVENISPYLNLKEQTLESSQSKWKEIENIITKSVDRLSNNLYQNIKTLENNIKTHWCQEKKINNNQHKSFHECKKKEKMRNKVIRAKQPKKTKHKGDKNSNYKSNKFKNKSNYKKNYKIRLISDKNMQEKKYKTDKLLKSNSNVKRFYKNLSKENTKVKYSNESENKLYLKKKEQKSKRTNRIAEKDYSKNDLKKLKNNVNTIFLKKAENFNKSKKCTYEYAYHPKENVSKELNFTKKEEIEDKFFINGEWFINLGEARSKVRWNHHRSDWLFDRAQGRRKKMEISYWLFQRAWAREQCRQNPKLIWCRSTVIPFNTQST
uniref:Uncharacterized protein n=2 Tax=Clastoptera arizonana TaxID=38151 RepID=A0A1B6DYF6_9HEMI